MASGLSITDFCTPPSYCPATSLTRERLAYFIVRAFNLPMASLASPSFAWKGGGISHEVAYLIPKTKSLASVPDFGLPQTDKVITAPRQSLQGMTITASFVYDRDGNRVAQTVNGVTTYFVGNYYEVTGSTVTKYYYAGGQRVAMRTDTIPQNSTLSYLLADHLNSISLTLDASGNVLSELRYTAWGEVRYASGNTPTDYTYTGQYANVDDFGLMFYNARWYDPYLNHFTQPDTIVPDQNNPQAWDRYAYTFNNPLRYTDPSGHCPICVGLVLVGAFLFFNGTNDSYQPNLSAAELESRQVSVGAGTSLMLSGLSIQAPIVELVSNTYDCATGYCDPSLMLPGSSHAYADTAEEVLDDTDSLITRTYTYGDESFEYVFDPNNPAALGYTEDLADLSPDDYNLLRVPDDIYDNTSVQKDFMRDIVESGVYPEILSNPNDQPWRIFSRYEMKLLDRFERRFGKWYE